MGSLMQTIRMHTNPGHGHSPLSSSITLLTTGELLRRGPKDIATARACIAAKLLQVSMSTCTFCVAFQTIPIEHV